MENNFLMKWRFRIDETLDMQKKPCCWIPTVLYYCALLLLSFLLFTRFTVEVSSVSRNYINRFNSLFNPLLRKIPIIEQYTEYSLFTVGFNRFIKLHQSLLEFTLQEIHNFILQYFNISCISDSSKTLSARVYLIPQPNKPSFPTSALNALTGQFADRKE